MTRFDNLMGKLGKVRHQTDETPGRVESSQPKTRKRRGKRNDPNYTQVTAYIRKETHNQVKIALLQEGGEREFSELVEDLLNEYLRTRTSKSSKT